MNNPHGDHVPRNKPEPEPLDAEEARKRMEAAEEQLRKRYNYNPGMHRVRKGTKRANYRTMDDAKAHLIWVRNDLWEALKSKSMREKTTLRSLYENAIYELLTKDEDAETGHLPHP